MTNQLFISKKDTSQIMTQVIIALIPGLVVIAWINPLWLLQPLLCASSASITEGVILKLRSKNIVFYLQDRSAVLTGLLLGICLPPESPFWLPVIGGMSAIALGKQVYGGLGANPFNPAMVGYVVLLLGFPSEMTQWQGITTTGATLLDRSNEMHWSTWPNEPLYWRTSALSIAFAIGGLWLIKRQIISWHIPTGVLVGFLITQIAFWLVTDTAMPMNLTTFGGITLGSLLYGAFFIATDPVTAPQHKKNQLIIAFAIGFFTALIRQGDQYPEGFAFAILLCNLLTPSLNNYNLRFS